MRRFLQVSAASLAGLALSQSATAALLVHYDGSVSDPPTSPATFLDVENTGTDYDGMATGTGITQSAVAAIGSSAINIPLGNTCVNVTADPLNATFAHVSISLWVKPNTVTDANTTGRSLIGKMGSTDQRGWQMYRNGQSTVVSLQYFKNAADTSVNNFSLGENAVTAADYSLLTFTFSAGTLKGYVNGVQVASQTFGDTTFNFSNTSPLQIGNRGLSSTYSADALLDDIGLWDETLSPQRVAAMYALGKFADENLQSAAITNLLTAFGSQGETTINGIKWEYTTGLSGAVGATGGTAGHNAYVVLGEGVGMQQVPEPAAVTLGLLTGGLFLRRRRQK